MHREIPLLPVFTFCGTPLWKARTPEHGNWRYHPETATSIGCITIYFQMRLETGGLDDAPQPMLAVSKNSIPEERLTAPVVGVTPDHELESDSVGFRGCFSYLRNGASLS